MKTNTFTKAFSMLFSKRTLMFLFFLAIAAVAWFINRLSAEYRTELAINVCVYSSSNQKSTQLCSNESLPVTAKATGFYILQQRLTKPPVVYVDIKNQRVRQSGSRTYMLASALHSDISQLLGDVMAIEMYSRDTIFFHGTDKKEVPPQGVIFGNEPLNLPK